VNKNAKIKGDKIKGSTVTSSAELINYLTAKIGARCHCII